MRFDTTLPHAALRPWVRYYWLLDAPAGLSMESEPVAPDGTFELVVHLDEPPEQRVRDGWVQQERAILVGEIQRPTILRAAGPVRCLGVHFAPGGLSAFFDEPATLLADRVTPLDVVSRPFTSLRERLEESDDLAAAGRTLDAILLARLRSRAPDARTRAVLDSIEESRGRVTMEALASDAGVSVRHLERILRPLLGVPPKRYARVVRFHHAFSALLDGDRDGALDAYFDQSHFLRDLREFASATARHALSSPLLLNRSFARGARAEDQWAAPR